MQKYLVIITGAFMGFFSSVLVKMGNPLNMGICVACFIRDIAGALGLHRAAVVQYNRPEVYGIMLGAYLVSNFTGEFKVKGGSSPIIRFVLGFIIMIGALVFLGCPWRMLLRIAGGDPNAFVGLFGYIVGIWIGVQFLKMGFSLGRSSNESKPNGHVLPIIGIILLILAFIKPAFMIYSASGPGSQHAPLMVALVIGLSVGVLGQRSRFCTAGGIRDMFLIKDPHLLIGALVLVAAAFVGNIAFGLFNWGASPIGHSDGLWNFLGMVLVGLGSVLLGGCPGRQLVLAGQGNSDSAITVLGLAAGAAFAHNLALASSPAGASANGKIAVIIGLAVVTIIAFTYAKEGFGLFKKGGATIEG